jgi:hypothetical protein
MGMPCSTPGMERDACRLLVGHLGGKRPLGRQVIDGRIILRLILDVIV